MHLRVGHKHSWFLSVLTRFVDYYSPFWGPEAISIVVEPQGALTCRSSTIAVWANFGSFLGLLLSFGGPGVISMIYKPRGAFAFQSSTPTFLADSGPFRALLLTAFGSQSDFHGC